jgi:enterochelin esterase-like enzyme
MSRGSNASRTHLWLESPGDWSWPGRGGAGRSAPLPPAWVPAFPPRLEPAVALAGQPGAIPSPGRTTPRRLLLGALLSALAAVCIALAAKGPLGLERILGGRVANRPALADTVVASPTAAAPQPLPTFVSVSRDAAGSSIDQASYSSHALGGKGSFLVYLPPGYVSTTRHFPVLYLLHGQNGHADAFLQIGLQARLDRLIEQGAIPPMIAVMIQDASGDNNWQNIGRRHSETYVLEVQELVDHMLPTIPTRAGRAIAGSSKGGYGAMLVALGNPHRFAVVESWLGFFDSLGGRLRRDQAVLSRLGLRAFLYGAESDTVAHAEEDPAFAARLRAAGASAESAVYPGGHSLETLSEHLDDMLMFAGRALFGAS